MKPVLAAAAALALGACSPPGVTELTGLDYGPRHQWTKEGATERETRIQMFTCADEHPGLGRTATVSAVPVVGLFAVGRLEDLWEGRFRCMQAAGYRMIDIRTGIEQRRDPIWGLAPVQGT